MAAAGPRIACVVTAAGAASRLPGNGRKLFAPVAGEPLLLRACRALRRHPAVFEIIVAAHPGDLEALRGEGGGVYAEAGMTLAVAGGGCRAQSVWNALEVVSAAADLVAVHDVARPFFSEALLGLLAKEAARRGAAVPVLPPGGAVKRIEGAMLGQSPASPRGLALAQTPQVFRSDLLIDAYEYAIRMGGLTEALVDDALVVERFGAPVAAVFGEPLNFKISTPDDLRLAEWLIAGGKL